MSSNSATDAAPLPPRRTLFVTVLGWVIIVLSTLMLPITGITILMFLARSYGTSTWDPIGFFIIVVLPPTAFVAGIGLLRRWPVARYYIIFILAFIITLNSWKLLTARASTTVTISPSGTRTTVTRSGPNYTVGVPVVLISSLLLVGLFTRRVRAEFGRSRKLKAPANPQVDAGLPDGLEKSAASPPSSEVGRDWNVGHQGRDRMYYEEKHAGAWQRIDIDGEMLTGPAHHVIYFASPEQWQRYPQWARHRRDEIINRIKSEFRPPDYEYHEDDEPSEASPPVPPPLPPSTVAALTTPSASPVVPAATVPSAAVTHVTAKQYAAFCLVIVLLLSITVGMSWLVTSGLNKGATYLPTKNASHRHPVSRQQEPIVFWISIGTYAAVGLGTGALALWLTLAARQGNR